MTGTDSNRSGTALDYDVLVVRTGTANLAAVLAALGRLGLRSRLSDSPSQVASAQRVILPGVGAFRAAQESLVETGLVQVLRDRVNEGRPTLGICLGLHLLANGSEESPGVPGLGCIDAVATEFPAGQGRVPQMGWNEVSPDPECSLIPSGFAYYANSYRLEAAPGWATAWTTYGEPFVAAVERGPVVASQFHPELSGAFGRQLLTRWLEASSC